MVIRKYYSINKIQKPIKIFLLLLNIDNIKQLV